VPYLNQRVQFGKTLYSFQGIQFDVARCAVGPRRSFTALEDEAGLIFLVL